MALNPATDMVLEVPAGAAVRPYSRYLDALTLRLSTFQSFIVTACVTGGHEQQAVALQPAQQQRMHAASVDAPIFCWAHLLARDRPACVAGCPSVTCRAVLC